MHFSRLRLSVYLGSLGLASIGHASSFDYVGLNDTWPTSGWGSSADWSSELGLDYRCGWGNDGTNTTLSGDGTGWSNKALAAGADSGFNLSWELNKKGGAAGETFSGGDAQIAAAGPLDTAISSMHLFNELGENNIGHGIETGSYITSTMGCSLDYQWQPIYYAIEWVVTYSGVGEAYGSVGVGGFGWDYQPNRTLFSGLITGSGSVSGTSVGVSTRYSSDGTYNYPLFTFGSNLRDYAGINGAGRLDTTLRFRFSDQPIDSVPEPTSLLVLALGIVPLLNRRRKSRLEKG